MNRAYAKASYEIQVLCWVVYFCEWKPGPTPSRRRTLVTLLQSPRQKASKLFIICRSSRRQATGPVATRSPATLTAMLHNLPDAAAWALEPPRAGPCQVSSLLCRLAGVPCHFPPRCRSLADHACRFAIAVKPLSSVIVWVDVPI